MSHPLLQVENLSIRFGDNAPAVRGLSFSVDRGETLAVVGESGSGKSISALSILQLLNPNLVSYPTGRVVFDDQDLLAANEKQLRKVRGSDIAMIFQEPMTSLNPLHSVERQITEVLSLHRGLRPTAAKKRCIELLGLVGIPDPEERLSYFPHQLSGGQKQRVMIAMALANEPRLLIADEPTTALDVTVQKQILELLKKLQKQLGMAVLLITHDLSIVRRYADRIVVMNQGQKVEEADTQTLFTQPQNEYTRVLLDAEPPASPPEAAAGDLLLAVENLQVRFPLGRRLFGKPKRYLDAVYNASFSVRRGETLGIVGESGSGKTTLGHALLKLVKAQGKIVFCGDDLSRLDQAEFRPYRRRLQLVFQDPFGSLSPRMSIGQIISEGLEIHHPASREAQQRRVEQVLTEVGLSPDTQHRYPHEFSGGQRQRIAIARALVLEPDLIVLDEPTSALDRTVQKQIIELLIRLQKTHGLCYLFISHDLAVVRALSHQLLVMQHGKVVEYGPAEQVLNSPKTAYTRQLLEAAFFYGTDRPSWESEDH